MKITAINNNNQKSNNNNTKTSFNGRLSRSSYEYIKALKKTEKHKITVAFKVLVVF